MFHVQGNHPKGLIQVPLVSLLFYVLFKTAVFLISQIPEGLSLLRYEKPSFTRCRAHSPATWGSKWSVLMSERLKIQGFQLPNDFACLSPSWSQELQSIPLLKPQFWPNLQFSSSQIWYCTAWVWMLQVHHNLYSNFEMSSDEKPSKTNYESSINFISPPGNQELLYNHNEC